MVTIKRPKMVKGHYLQGSPHHKIFSASKSERIQCQGWNFFWFLANELVVLFFLVNYLIRASHYREFCVMVLSVRMSAYTKQSNFNGTKQVILFY